MVYSFSHLRILTSVSDKFPCSRRLVGCGEGEAAGAGDGLVVEEEEDESEENAEKDGAFLGSASRKLVNGRGRP